MYYLTLKDHFDAAHHLDKGYQGACERQHGHSFHVDVVWKVEQLNSVDMGYDFKVLKTLIQSVLDEFDHRDLNTLEYFKDTNPTAEILSVLIYNKLDSIVIDVKINLDAVTVWESEKAGCTYRNESKCCSC